MADSRGDMGDRVDIMALVRDMRDQILREMHSGFKGVHHRQDVANGRVSKLEEFAGRIDERVNGLDERSGEIQSDIEQMRQRVESVHLHRRESDPQPPVKLQ